jgi:hypothetical protein
MSRSSDHAESVTFSDTLFRLPIQFHRTRPAENEVPDVASPVVLAVTPKRKGVKYVTNGSLSFEK